MAYILSKNPKVRYSPTEQEVFRILARYAGNVKKLPTTQLVSWDLYGDAGDLPFHADQIAGGAIRSLMRKLDANEEPFKLQRVKIPGKKVVWRLTKNN